MISHLYFLHQNISRYYMLMMKRKILQSFQLVLVSPKLISVKIPHNIQIYPFGSPPFSYIHPQIKSISHLQANNLMPSIYPKPKSASTPKLPGRNNNSTMRIPKKIEGDSRLRMTGWDWYPDSKKPQQLILIWDYAIKSNPNQWQSYKYRAKYYRELGDLKKALKDTQTWCQLLQIAPQKPDLKDRIFAHYQCGCLLGELGKEQPQKLLKAETRLKSALRLCHDEIIKPTIQKKYKRLKKLMWLKRREKEISLIQSEKSIVFKSYIRTEISEYQYKTLNEVLEQRYKMLNKPLELPDHLLCKITMELMVDPVVNQYGFAYQRSALKQFYKTRRESHQNLVDPVLRKPITRAFVSSLTIKAAVSHFLEENPWAFQFAQKDYDQIRMI